MQRKSANQRADVQTHGAERGLDRFEGSSDAVFAIALTLLIVEIKVPGSPAGPHGYLGLAADGRAVARISCAGSLLRHDKGRFKPGLVNVLRNGEHRLECTGDNFRIVNSGFHCVSTLISVSGS